MISFCNIINLDIRTKSDFEIESNYIRCTIPFEQEVIDQIDNKNVCLNKSEKKENNCFNLWWKNCEVEFFDKDGDTIDVFLTPLNKLELVKSF